jgi:TPR repeat protein
MIALSEAYRFGNHGATVQPDSANYYLRQAAGRGVTDAFYLLGVAHFRGLGVARSANKGFDYLKKAAGKGHQLALEILIDAYSKPFTRFGRSPYPVDSAKALKFALQAAKLGNVKGMRFAAEAYHRCSGVARNDSLAIRWNKRAALRQGDAQAQQTLGDWFFRAETREGLDLRRAQRYYRLLMKNPQASLEQSTAGEVGAFNAAKLQRRAVNLRLLMGTITPEAAPQIAIRP